MADDLIHLDICGLTFGQDQYSKLIPIIEQSKILSLHIDKDAPIKFEQPLKTDQQTIKNIVSKTTEAASYMEQLIDSKIQKQARQMIPQDNLPEDTLILTRHLNAPEIDIGCWTNQECHLCHKHKYTMIFFHQDNQALIEIKDPTVLQSFDSVGSTPVIYGLG